MNRNLRNILAAGVLIIATPTIAGCSTIGSLFGDEQADFSIQVAEAEASYAALVESATTLANEGKLSLQRADRIDVAIDVAGGTLDRVNEALRAGEVTEAKGHYKVLESVLLELAALISRENIDNTSSDGEV